MLTLLFICAFHGKFRIWMDVFRRWPSNSSCHPSVELCFVVEVMAIWKSYMWTAEWRMIWRKIIAVIYATFAVAKKRLKTILFKWNLPAIFSSFTKSTEPTATLSPRLPSWRGLLYLSVICLINDLVITRCTRLFAVLKLFWTAQRGSCTWA